jgi:hypothetical protein
VRAGFLRVLEFVVRIKLKKDIVVKSSKDGRGSKSPCGKQVQEG